MTKPDNRRDNAERIQNHIDNTMHNIELANDMISSTSDEKLKTDLQDKNERRADAIDSFRDEFRDEYWDRENGYE